MNNYCNYKNYLVNGTFNLPDIKTNSFKRFKGNDVKGWTFNNSLIIDNSKSWGLPIPYPCGKQVCSIQGKSSISQIVSVPKPGKYSLIIYYVGRREVGNTINFLLNGKQIHSLVNPPVNSWNSIILELNLTSEKNNKLDIIGTAPWEKNANLSTAIQLILTDLIQDKSSMPKTEPKPKSTPIPNKVDFDYDENVVPVFITGDYGIAPWGKNSNFPDLNAKWIWYCEKSNFDSPNNENSPITFQYLYMNNTNDKLNTNLNILIDNECEVFLNSQKIKSNNGDMIAKRGWNKTKNDWNIFPCIISPGSNLFEFKVKSVGGPAGLVVSATRIDGSDSNNNNVLFRTDGGWKFIPLAPKPVKSSNLSQPGLISTIDKSFPFGCLALNGSSTQFVNIGKTITGMKGLSFGFWFRSNKNKNWTGLIDFGNGQKNNNILLYVHGDKIGLTIYLMDKVFEGHKHNLSPNINDNKWNHLVLTIKPDQKKGSQCVLYLNNNQVSSFQYVYPINMERINCYIGKSGNPNDSYFSGAISNFVMYQKVLEEKEINALYMSMINLNDRSLYIYLPFSTNSVLDTLLNNYAGKTFSLPITKSKVDNENWTCVEDKNKKWISVKMENKKPICMSMDGKTCIEEETEKACEIRASNPIVPSNPIICDKSKMSLGWCNIANKELNSENKEKTKMPTKIKSDDEDSESIDNIKPGVAALSALQSNVGEKSLDLKPLPGGGQILKLSNMLDVEKLMIDGVFKLRVNLPNMPPYIKGKTFDINKSTNPNYFYLSVEKLDPNCNIKASNGKCVQTFADDKKCNVKALTSYVQSNTFRLVLVSSQYALDPAIPMGKNSDFTLVKVNNQLYLRNVQTGYLPSLYSNDMVLPVFGDMEIKPNSNVNKIYNQLNNTLCNQEIPPLETKGTSFVKCNIKKDDGTYLITTKNIGSSSPIRVNFNSDKTISLNLLSFNSYGYPTKVYSLTSCNFNVQTYKYIEKMTNNLGTFMINMVCFEDTQNSKANPKNQLKFTVELINFPKNFMKDNSIFDIN